MNWKEVSHEAIFRQFPCYAAEITHAKLEGSGLIEVQPFSEGECVQITRSNVVDTVMSRINALLK